MLSTSHIHMTQLVSQIVYIWNKHLRSRISHIFDYNQKLYEETRDLHSENKVKQYLLKIMWRRACVEGGSRTQYSLGSFNSSVNLWLKWW